MSAENWERFLRSIEGRDVLLDVDGVLADFKGHLLRSVGSSHSPDEITGYEIFDVLSADENELGRLLLRMPMWWENIPVIPGAQAAVKIIREHAMSVIFATAPWVSCKGWEHARRSWLNRHFDAKHKDVCPWSEKHRIVGHVIVEDKPENVTKFHFPEMNRVAWCYSQPYNASFDWPHRINWPTER